MPLPRLKPEISGEELHDLAREARKAADLLKVLSHQSRLLILSILADGEKTVGEIEILLGVQQAMVSQQLARLRMEGLVTARRAGRLVFYSIASPEITVLVSSLLSMMRKPAEFEM